MVSTTKLRDRYAHIMHVNEQVKGQAVLMSLQGKGPSSFNAGKAEAAGKSLQAALAAESLPSQQRAAVEAQAEEAKGMLYALNPACAQM